MVSGNSTCQSVAPDLDCLFAVIVFFNCVDCLLHVAQDKIAVAVIRLDSVSLNLKALKASWIACDPHEGGL
jgi:hypothetical protein